MRIEGGSYLGNQIRLVWHCREMRSPVCQWIDTDTAKYCEFINLRTNLTQTKQARKILFVQETLSIYIDPIPDEIESRQISTQKHLYQPKPQKEFT